MIFNSPAFLVFFAVVYAGYLLLPSPRAQNILLLAASYFFYGWAAPKYLALLGLYTVVTYAVAVGIEASDRQRIRKALLVAGILINLAVLGYFKYFNFFVGEFFRALQILGIPAQRTTLEIFLPIGVSFFTFQSIAYMVDVYHRKVPAVRDIIVFGVFKAFFPQLVAGPIERAEHMMPQLERARWVTREDLLQGAYWMALGFFLKCVIADRLASYADYQFAVLAGPYRGPLAAFDAVSAFGLQIYSDFAGYTYIALGIARLMGIQLQRNFLGPYLACSIQEFWRCWHVTLSSWLRDYLYIPLGGSHRGTFRTHLNLIITMGLGGLWHGASWNFVLWGLFHGAGLAVHRALAPSFGGLPDWLRRYGGWSLTLLFVMFGWSLFRVASMSEFTALWHRAFSPGEVSPVDLQATAVIASFGFVILMVQWLEERHPERPLVARAAWHWNVCMLTAMTLSVVAVGFSDHRFIYFQF
jgi:D-alanyl-lipoteichoic acid acyltransferase DltB (MBOAT superfamily)